MLDDSKVKDKNLIEILAKEAWKASKIAARVQGVSDESNYSIIFDYIPEREEDGLFDFNTNEIFINLSALHPMNLREDAKEFYFTSDEEEKGLSERERVIGYAFSTVFAVFHEMRHLYQADCIRSLKGNERCGYELFHQHEKEQTIKLWDQEMVERKRDTDPESLDIEMDAEFFSIYMIHRYPIPYEFEVLNDRLKRMRKRYDRIPIPEAYSGDDDDRVA